MHARDRTTRLVRFELHILPLFRLIDRDHMAASFDLHDADAFYDAAGRPRMRFINTLKKHLSGEATPIMPPAHAGGPWPQEWIDLYNRWIQEGCPRLEFGTAQYRARRLSDTEVSLFARVELPSTEHEVWFDRRHEAPPVWSYTLYLEPPPGTPSGQSEIRHLTEQINDIPPSITSVTVHDAAGTQSVDIAGSPPPIA